MKQRGRVGAEGKAVSVINNVIEIARPDAPYDLNDAEAEEWRAIVNRMPADHFPRETWPLLTQLCRSVVTSHAMAKLRHEMEKNEKFDVTTYMKLVASEQAVSKTIAMLSMKMRLAQESVYENRTKKPIMMERPWDRHD